jgi:predicted nucleotidyltransferase
VAAVVNLLEAALRRIVADLEQVHAKWAIVGGLAVSARAQPRTTRDVDVVVAVGTDAEAENLVRALHACGYRVRAVVEHEAAGRLATARLSHAEGAALLVDILFASSGIEPEVVDRADRLEILPGLTANVATIGHLLALKVLARDDRTRPQDWDDIRALLAEAGDDDIGQAREALALIEARGYARGRPLRRQLEEILVPGSVRS